MPVQVVDSCGRTASKTNTISSYSLASGVNARIGCPLSSPAFVNIPSNQGIRRVGSRLGLSISTDTGRNHENLPRNFGDRIPKELQGISGRTPPRFNNSSILELVTIQKKMKETPEFIKEINAGLESDKNPLRMIESGEGGVYIIHNQDKKMIAIFKPQDEDPFSPNNPKQRDKSDAQAIKQGILPGEPPLNEVAAYLLDYDGFAGVPYTVIAGCDHSSSGFQNKIGSLQKYVTNIGDCSEIGPKNFSKKDVHHIGILDIRILNVDRHAGNVLVQERENVKPGDLKYKLVPIDHAYSFPDSFKCKNLWFEWYNWRQSKVPFDEETLAYIHKLDPFADANLLRQNLGLRDECIRTMIIATSILKAAAKRQMTLAQIAELFFVRQKKSFAEEIADRFSPDERFNTTIYRDSLRICINNALDVRFHHLSVKDRKCGRIKQVQFYNPKVESNSISPPSDSFKRQNSVPAHMDELQFPPDYLLSELPSNPHNNINNNSSNFSYNPSSSSSLSYSNSNNSYLNPMTTFDSEYDLSTMSPPSYYPSLFSYYAGHKANLVASSPNPSTSTSSSTSTDASVATSPTSPLSCTYANPPQIFVEADSVSTSS